MADPTDYHLQVTAGPSYDTSTHKLVPVNTEQPIDIESEHLSAKLCVRIQNFRGIPGDSPETSPYFSHTEHASSLYSIAFTFTPKHDINGDDLLFGNDFEKPIRDNLPPGFGAALRLVRWAIDPGLDGDVYADHPYLYGPLLSSINTLWIGDGPDDEPEPDADDAPPPTDSSTTTTSSNDNDKEPNPSTSPPTNPLPEGGTPAGTAHRTANAIPSTAAARMKHFLTPAHRTSYTAAAGRPLACDFFNPYLDFNDLSLRLPGMSLQLMRFWDGQPLRYTLRVRGSAELLVVVFTLVPKDEVEAVEKRWRGDSVDGSGGGGGADSAGAAETSADDVD